MSLARHDSGEIYDAASFACVGLLPPSTRAAYVRDIRAKYKAEPIVYLLQVLSQGMTAIFVGLLTNYLYDKTKSKAHARKMVDLKRARRRQRYQLRTLQRRIIGSKGERPITGFRRRYAAYDRLLTRIAIHRLPRR